MRRMTQVGLLALCMLATAHGTPAGHAADPATRWLDHPIRGDQIADRGGAVQTGIAYGPLPRQKLDVYRADPAIDTGVVVVFYYGGSWTSGNRGIYRFVGSALASRGITAVIPDYRVFPDVQFPEFMVDAAKAYGWVAANIQPSCGRERPIIVAGHSAGAHIAALLSLDGSYLLGHATGVRPPAGLIGLAGPYSFDPTTWPSTRKIFAPASATPDKARPVAYARNPNAPPTLLLHGRDDETVKMYNTRDLAAALRDAGRPARVIEYDGIGHVGLVLTMSTLFRWRASTLNDMAAFIEPLTLKPCERPSGSRAR